MNMLTVRQVAKISGVSVRALHHYDTIGLLKPASTGRNGYRYYGRDELLRLQQILLHRELGVSLSEIKGMLDAPGFDRLDALRRQRNKLAAEVDRYAQLVRTIDRTIADLTGDSEMKNEDLYTGVTPPRQAEYEAWLVEKYGGDIPERIAVSRRKFNALSESERAGLMRELKDIDDAWSGAMKNGIPADSPALDPLLERHRTWVAAMWDKPCPPEAYAGLARMHLSHPDFVARYEAIAPGFSDYHAEAMQAYARRQVA